MFRKNSDFNRIPISNSDQLSNNFKFHLRSSLALQHTTTTKRNDDNETTTTITHPPSRLSSEDGRSSFLYFSVTPNFGRNDFLRFRPPARHRRHPKQWTMTTNYPSTIRPATLRANSSQQQFSTKIEVEDANPPSLPC